jgi:hypothetical protein
MTTNSRKNTSTSATAVTPDSAADKAADSAAVADTLPTDDAAVEPASTELQTPTPDAVAPAPAAPAAPEPAAVVDAPANDGLVSVLLAHPLDKPEDLRRLGLKEKAGVGGEIRISPDHARMLINAGYAQTDPEDQEAVAAVLGANA